MRIISIILFAVVLGGLGGAAVAYVQIRNDLDPVNDFPGEIKLSAKSAQR